jgi:hypothetical protein
MSAHSFPLGIVLLILSDICGFEIEFCGRVRHEKEHAIHPVPLRQHRRYGLSRSVSKAREKVETTFKTLWHAEA